jgi:hypothetical protein
MVMILLGFGGLARLDKVLCDGTLCSPRRLPFRLCRRRLQPVEACARAPLVMLEQQQSLRLPGGPGPLASGSADLIALGESFDLPLPPIKAPVSNGSGAETIRFRVVLPPVSEHSLWRVQRGSSKSRCGGFLEVQVLSPGE